MWLCVRNALLHTCQLPEKEISSKTSTDLEFSFARVPPFDMLAQVAGGGEKALTVLAHVRPCPRVATFVKVQIVLVSSFVRALFAGVVTNALVDFYVID